jgi:hypothetical protein
MSRFDYVRYDDASIAKQKEFKAQCENLELLINKHLPNGRHQALALTALEEVYMWIGKALRDAQIESVLQEERTNS